ncbi:MAG: DNA-binding response regulator [Methylomonas sp.]|jgi:DNA-binding NarL/FixJ family response regulator
MKIYVIDNTGQIQTQWLAPKSDVGFFADEIQAVNALDQKKPDLILLHYGLRGKESARYIDLLQAICPNAVIVLIGEQLSDDQVIPCLVSGAKGYQDSAELAIYIEKIIKVTARGEAWIGRRLTARLLDTIRRQNRLENQEFYFSGQYIHSAAYQKM